jgi:hypothetical protein
MFIHGSGRFHVISCQFWKQVNSATYTIMWAIKMFIVPKYGEPLGFTPEHRR